MAENTDNPSFNFGIENTMEMGMGNTELLEGLLGPDSATGDPDGLEKIVKEVDEPAPQKTPASKVKELDPPKEEEKPKQNLIADFFGNDEDNTIENEEVEKPEATSKEPELEEEKVEEVSQFNLLSKDLLKLGVFTKEDDEEDLTINTPEEFLERFNAEKVKGAREMLDNFIGQFGEDYQNAFQAIYVNGVDPKEYFGTYNKIVNFAELDLTQEDNQKAVMREALADQGFDPEDINDEIDRLTNYGDLESVSKKHHKVLVKKEAAKLQQLEQKAEQEKQQKAAIRNQYVQNVNTVLQEKLKTKEFDGIPLNPKLATELQDFLLVDKYKTATGETLTDFDRAVLELKRPENHAMKVKIALLMKILEKDPTLSTIQQSGVTKKSDKLFGELARHKEKVATPQGKSNSWFS